jgi:hypothetical protein
VTADTQRQRSGLPETNERQTHQYMTQNEINAVLLLWCECHYEPTKNKIQNVKNDFWKQEIKFVKDHIN